MLGVNEPINEPMCIFSKYGLTINLFHPFNNPEVHSWKKKSPEEERGLSYKESGPVILDKQHSGTVGRKSVLDFVSITSLSYFSLEFLEESSLWMRQHVTGWSSNYFCWIFQESRTENTWCSFSVQCNLKNLFQSQLWSGEHMLYTYVLRTTSLWTITQNWIQLLGTCGLYHFDTPAFISPA